MVLTVASPIVLTGLLIFSIKTLRQIDPNTHASLYEARYKPLVEGLNTRSRIGRYWMPITLARWAVFAGVLVMGHEEPSLQIGLILMLAFTCQIL